MTIVMGSSHGALRAHTLVPRIARVGPFLVRSRAARQSSRHDSLAGANRRHHHILPAHRQRALYGDRLQRQRSNSSFPGSLGCLFRYARFTTMLDSTCMCFKGRMALPGCAADVWPRRRDLIRFFWPVGGAGVGGPPQQCSAFGVTCAVV